MQVCFLLCFINSFLTFVGFQLNCIFLSKLSVGVEEEAKQPLSELSGLCSALLSNSASPPAKNTRTPSSIYLVMSASLQRASTRVRQIAKSRMGAREEDEKKLLYQLALGFLGSENIKPVCTANHTARRRPIFSSPQSVAQHFKTYVSGSRNGVAVVDSDKTLICLRNALNFMARVRGEKAPKEDDRKLLYKLAWEYLDDMKVAVRQHRNLPIEVQPTDEFPRSDLDKLAHQHLVKRLQEIKVAQVMADFYR